MYFVLKTASHHGAAGEKDSIHRTFEKKGGGTLDGSQGGASTNPAQNTIQLQLAGQEGRKEGGGCFLRKTAVVQRRKKRRQKH